MVDHSKLFSWVVIKGKYSTAFICRRSRPPSPKRPRKDPGKTPKRPPPEKNPGTPPGMGRRSRQGASGPTRRGRIFSFMTKGENGGNGGMGV